MTKYIVLLCAFVVPVFSAAQNTVSEGARLFFANTASKLSAAEKNAIYTQLGFLLSADKKQFILDKESADFPFDVLVYPTDLNKDGKEEVFVQYGNAYTSGQSGSSIVLFIQDKTGNYKQHLGFPGLTPEVLTTTNQGYPDLIIGGPGFAYPVWRWNGNAYNLHRQVKEADLLKLKRTPVEVLSKAYTKAIQ